MNKNGQPNSIQPHKQHKIGEELIGLTKRYRHGEDRSIGSVSSLLEISIIAVIEMPLSVEEKDEMKKVIKITTILLKAELASEALKAAKKRIAYPGLFKAKAHSLHRRRGSEDGAKK